MDVQGAGGAALAVLCVNLCKHRRLPCELVELRPKSGVSERPCPIQFGYDQG